MGEAKRSAAVPVDFKVTLRNSQGHYLAQDDNGLYFCDERARAIVLNYYGDQVQTQLDALREEAQVALEPEPVPPEEIYERCDRCQDLFHPTMIRFDGARFLCPDCQKLAAKPRPPALKGAN